ncbi:butyrate kinase [Acidaminobacter hydrogenoformans]|uniref:Probable butyrate kinase n=1 Tax=Acidaminobacter hydrogenoformans DSM 2784 TaxID=1120920 RepID=A0A1G5S2L9_9FIRM|nr:butyrate kinase [Acidaminobacter hydrogenoformans]SCZ80001.1 butyrate kinase [Acidaminobacter hydrogenoformans DSM 2784]
MDLLVINIGGSSTKIALFNNKEMIKAHTIRHSVDELKLFKDIWDQYEFRKASVLDYCKKNQIDIENLGAIVSRGPSVKPIKSGVYKISEDMVRDAESNKYGTHPCGLGCKMAMEISNNRILALTVDPPCVDEMIPAARYTGLPSIKRHSFFQALNHKAVAKRLAMQLDRKYEEMNIVVCHLGSGISVASHSFGRVIDVTNGLDGDAPFGLDRVGTLPAGDWMRFCLSGEHTRTDLERILNGGGGMMAHLGTNSAIEVEKMIKDGDKKAEEVYDAMAFNVIKGVGAASSIFGSKPDAIIFTGGLANSDYFIEKLKCKLSWIANIFVFAGEDEMLALAEGALRALNNEEALIEY